MIGYSNLNYILNVISRPREKLLLLNYLPVPHQHSLSHLWNLHAQMDWINRQPPQLSHWFYEWRREWVETTLSYFHRGHQQYLLPTASSSGCFWTAVLRLRYGMQLPRHLLQVHYWIKHADSWRKVWQKPNQIRMHQCEANSSNQDGLVQRNARLRSR